MWIAAGSAWSGPRREALLDAARDAIAADGLAMSAGATAPGERVIVVRVLAGRVEPAMRLLVQVWRRWREVAWSMAACVPRVWGT